MALLERVGALRQQGLGDVQIMDSLKEEGFSPLQINEAFSQLKIKSAITNDPDAVDTQNMEKSIMISTEQQNMSVPLPTENNANKNNQTQAQRVYNNANNIQEGAAGADVSYVDSNQINQMPYDSSQQYMDAGQNYTNQGYEQYPQQYSPQYGTGETVYYSPSLDIDTVRDISKQEIEEALKKFKEQMIFLDKWRLEANFQIQGMENRMVKIETLMQDLQTAILRKIGDYGEAISSISKEIKETQNSFSKMINPLMDNHRKEMGEENDFEGAGTEEESFPIEKEEQKEEIQENAEATSQMKNKNQKKAKKNPDSGSRSQNNKGASFEDYFRSDFR